MFGKVTARPVGKLCNLFGSKKKELHNENLEGQGESTRGRVQNKQDDTAGQNR